MDEGHLVRRAMVRHIEKHAGLASKSAVGRWHEQIQSGSPGEGTRDVHERLSHDALHRYTPELDKLAGKRGRGMAERLTRAFERHHKYRIARPKGKDRINRTRDIQKSIKPL